MPKGLSPLQFTAIALGFFLAIALIGDGSFIRRLVTGALGGLSASGAYALIVRYLGRGH